MNEGADPALPAGDFSAWVVGMQAAIRGERESDVPCAGCTACCTSSQFVHIEPDETNTLAHIPAELLFPAPQLPRGHVLLGYDEHGHCPMLVDNRCSIYEHRPRTCRTYDCRIFAATGLAVDDDKPEIARRVARWHFSYPTDEDRARRAAVRRAVAAEDSPSTSHRAIRAVEVHDVFLYAPPMADFEVLAAVAAESEVFAAVLETGPLDGRVPGCPDWTLRDLAWHMGRVQQFWAKDVRVGTDVPPTTFDEDAPGPTTAPALAEWMRESTRDLLDALHTMAPDTPAWVWWRDDRTVGAIARHQVQEAAVHRWDAQSVAGSPDPLAPAIADDGVDEFLGLARQLREPAPITFLATDSGRSVSMSDEPSTVTVSAPASDLVLLLHRRIPPENVQVVGDRAPLDAFLQPIE